MTVSSSQPAAWCCCTTRTALKPGTASFGWSPSPQRNQNPTLRPIPSYRSWLTTSLSERGADFVAAGGTVTQTTSTRFGDVHGPRTTVTLELRGSWTARTPELAPHLLGFVDVLCTAAGLPPEGVSILPTT